MKKLKIYLAGPWFNEEQKEFHELAKRIISKCENVDCFFPDEESFGKTPKETFDGNVNAIRKCDAVVALIETKDVGTSWEIGMSYVLGKYIALVGKDENSFKRKTNLMLSFTGDCFTIDKLHKWLTEGLRSDEFVNIEREWEDIE